MNQVLARIIKNGRIAPAYLFVGAPGAGKTAAARDFTGQLGCKNIDQVWIEPDGASVKINQILELQRLVRYGPSASPYLVAIVERADEMTAEASGAFLKTLEEPPPRVVFVLTVEREERLPGTVLSRCQKLLFGESPEAWRPDPELEYFYHALRGIKGKGVVEILEFSSRLEKERERIEALLYDLIFYAKNEMGNIKWVRILLDAAKNIKKKANLKLALDVACLKLGEA